MNKKNQRFSNQSGSQNRAKSLSNSESQSRFQLDSQQVFQPKEEYREQLRDRSGQVVDFSESANKAKRNPQPISPEAYQHNLAQEQANANRLRARQEAQRLLACRREAIANILVTSTFAVMAAIALANFFPQHNDQKQKLTQITGELNQLEKKVEADREQFPSIFDSGKSPESNLRRNGWLKPGQVPIKPQTNPAPR